MVEETRNGDVIRRRLKHTASRAQRRREDMNRVKLSRPKIQLTSFRLDGECTFDIDGKEYKYRIDTGHLPEVQRLSKHAPGRALNLVKRVGTLIEEEKGDE